MSLTLSVVSHQKYSLRETTKTIDEVSMSIGREDCDWILEDATFFISRKHCLVEFKSGDYYLTDVSRHGVSINDQVIDKHTPVKLVNGAMLSMGDYKIAVRIDSAGWKDELDTKFGDNAQQRPSPSSFEPEKLPDPFDNLVSPQSPPNRIGRTFSDKQSYPLQLPELKNVVGKILPDDLFKETVTEMDQGSNKIGSPELRKTRKEEIVIKNEREQDLEEGRLLKAFLIGAKIKYVDIPLQRRLGMMTNLGAAFRETVNGIRAVLEARIEIKHKLRAYTSLWGQKPNPLKFLNDEEKIIDVLLTESDKFMSPAEAVQDGLSDIRIHELAMLAGMRASVAHILECFDPRRLEEKLGDLSVINNMLPMSRKAKYWDLFHNHYSRLKEEYEDGFLDLFGREFTRAYEKQAAKLREEKETKFRRS
jgi:type VI secretion system protein